jgi:inner membrane protein
MPSMAVAPIRTKGGAPLDNLTHGLVGAALAKSGAARTTPLATATLVIAANAPDIDVFSYMRGEYFALSFRRGITHSWLALLLLPFVVTAAMLTWDRLVRRRRSPDAEAVRAWPLLALSTIGVLTHPALDWMNTYGMRWGLPFNGAWTYGDALFVIDPWIWLVLGGAVFLSAKLDRNGIIAWAFLAMVASLVVLAFRLALPVKALWVTGLSTVCVLRLRRDDANPLDAARRTTRALIAVGLYLLTMVSVDLAARRDVRSAAIGAGLDVRDLMVAPQPANPFRAEVEVLTNEGYIPGDHRWLGTPRVRLYPEDFVPLVSGPAGLGAAQLQAVVAAARTSPEVGLYHVWSRFPYVRVDEATTGWSVRFSDARYDGQSGAGGLSGITITVTNEDLR